MRFREPHSKSDNTLRLSAITCSLMVLSILAGANHAVGKGWSVGGKVSVVNSGSSTGIKTAVKIEYQLSGYLTWRTDIEALMRELDNPSVDFSVPTNLLIHPFGSRGVLDPYLGPGLAYTYTYGGEHQFGANVLGGVNLRLKKKKTIGIEAKYTLPLYPSGRVGDFELGLTGALDLKF